jgi:hypothetical protein
MMEAISFSAIEIIFGNVEVAISNLDTGKQFLEY